MSAILEKRATEQFVQKNNLSIDEMNAKVQEVYDSYEASSFENDDARWARAYRRVRNALRQKAKTMSNSVEGMIVCRMTNKDFDRNQYDYAMRTLIKDGKDQAIAQGLVNQEGQPLYQWGDNKGSVILGPDNEPGRPQASGRAIGYTFTRNDEGDIDKVESRYIVINKKRADNCIPVCQMGNIAISIADSKQEKFPYANNNFAYYNDSSLSSVHKPPYNSEEINEILHEWNEAFGDKFTIVSNATQLSTFSAEHAYSKENKDVEYDFCVVAGNVVEIYPSQYGKYGNASVTLEFIDYETYETMTLQIFIDEDMLQGLKMSNDDQGIFVLQVSEGKEGVPRWHLGGFLPVKDGVNVEAFFGINLEE